MVLAETPAFERSATEAYGRPPTIFFAVAGPTPGRASSSFSDALLRSTGDDAVAAFLCSLPGLVVADVSAAAGAGAGAGPTVTRGVILAMVLAETPAFERSATEA